jgi:hypothetical protein
MKILTYTQRCEVTGAHARAVTMLFVALALRRKISGGNK